MKTRKDLPMAYKEKPSRFIFYCIAPFLLATIIVVPFAATIDGVDKKIGMALFEVCGVFLFLGLFDSRRFNWCLRGVGGIIFVAYVAYFLSMVSMGQWVGDGRRSSMNALNALLGLIVFGVPGLLFALFNRLTWHREENAEFFVEDSLEEFEEHS